LQRKKSFERKGLKANRNIGETKEENFIMVHVHISYLNGNTRHNPNSTLAKGEWILEEASQDVVIDKVYCTPTKNRSWQTQLDDCDRTPTTAPTTVTPTKIHFNRKGRPQSFEINSACDDWSVSTMGESIFDDAQPSRRIPKQNAKHSNILCGSF
jgi:hypothetical protein